MGWDAWNLVATIGGFTIGLSALVFLINVVRTRKRGEEAGADPWDARTLEWSIPSPPPVYNFLDVPVVHARDDFWHTKYTEDTEGRPARVFAGGATVHEEAEEEVAHGIHLPGPSYFPIVAALGIPATAYGVVYNQPIVIALGLLLTTCGLFGWVLEPAEEE
jgi:cytochrome c oxidase subunit 1